LARSIVDDRVDGGVLDDVKVSGKVFVLLLDEQQNMSKSRLAGSEKNERTL
jgi:hypothetical protein